MFNIFKKKEKNSIENNNVNNQQYNNNLLNEFLNKFPPSQDLIKPDENIINKYKDKLPQEIIDLWKNYGFGNYGDGLIKVINPDDYLDNLFTWLGKEYDNYVPIMITAFGDIFYYRKLTDTENDICMLSIHYRDIITCTYSYQEFFETYIVKDEIIKELLKKELFNEAINKLGKLTSEEIYYFVPALCLGGGENIKYIDKGKATVHQNILFQLGNK